MGMQHHEGPGRRRIGEPRVPQGYRLSRAADRLPEALQQPGMLPHAPSDGCSKGDVIVLVLCQMEERFAIPLQRELPRTEQLQSSIQISEEGRDRWSRLARGLGISRTAVIEVALRLVAADTLPRPVVDRIRAELQQDISSVEADEE